MTKRKKRFDELENLLYEARRRQPVPQLAPSWRQELMRRVRGLSVAEGAMERGMRIPPGFQKRLLHAAAASGVVALVLLAYGLGVLPGIEQDLFAALRQDPSGVLTAQALGM